MPVARPAIHPKPECSSALVRELRVAASAAGYGDRCGTRPRARRVYAGPERADRFLTISFQCKQAKRGRQKYTSILETHFDGNSLRYLGAYKNMFSLSRSIISDLATRLCRARSHPLAFSRPRCELNSHRGGVNIGKPSSGEVFPLLPPPMMVSRYRPSPIGFSSNEIDTWSTQFRYISLFACENSHYLCTGTRVRPRKNRNSSAGPNARSGGRSRHSESGMRARDTTARVVCTRQDNPGGRGVSAWAVLRDDVSPR